MGRRGCRCPADVIGNLADEYLREGRNFTGTAFDRVNCSVTADRAQLRWAGFVDVRIPLPTDPGNLPGGWDDNQSVGAFEGCGTFATGLFRPVLRCRMNQNTPSFCPVCAAEIRARTAPFL
jgi:IgA Peptidase M64